MEEKKPKKLTVYFMVLCALMAALMCVLGPMSVQIGIIPVTLTNLVIYISIILLGYKGATVSTIVYLLLGMVGLPVFSGYSGGLAKLAGPTGGYLVGFIFLALIAGFFCTKFKGNVVLTAVGMILGTAVLYTFGTIWFVIQMECTFAYAMSVCVIPFIVFDLAKMAIALALGTIVRSRLKKAKLIS